MFSFGRSDVRLFNPALLSATFYRAEWSFAALTALFLVQHSAYTNPRSSWSVSAFTEILRQVPSRRTWTQSSFPVFQMMRKSRWSQAQFASDLSHRIPSGYAESSNCMIPRRASVRVAANMSALAGNPIGCRHFLIQGCRPLPISIIVELSN